MGGQLGVLAVWSLAGGALGQGVLTADVLSNEAVAEYVDLNGSYFSSTDTNYSTSGVDFVDFRSAAYADANYDGKASAANAALYTPASPGIGGAFSAIDVNLRGEAVAVATNGPNLWFDVTRGYARNYHYFHLDQETDWSWEADVAVAAEGGRYNEAFYLFALYSGDYGIEYAYDSLGIVDGAGDFSEHRSLSGTLAPGDYIVTYGAGGKLNNDLYGAFSGTARGSVEGTFVLPAPGLPAALCMIGLAGMRRRRA